MENPPVGLRFRPTDEEIIDVYLRPKNLDGDTSHVDRVISTVTICSFDPWELPSESRMKLKDEAWCFFSRKENKYGKGERQMRKTKSGFWKITGKPKAIMRNRQKIGEKKILMFYLSKQLGGSKSDWVMHEYHLFSPNQMLMTYTLCKVMSKGEDREISSSSAASEIEQTHSLTPHLPVGSEGSSFHSQQLQNSSHFGATVQEEAQIDDANTPSEEEWKTWLVDNDDDDDDEQRSIMFMQDNRSDYRPPKSLTGVLTDDSSDDNDSDLLSATTNSIEPSSTCDSFASSKHRIGQIKDLQESPNSTIKLVSLTQEVSQALRTSNDTSEKYPYDDAQETDFTSSIETSSTCGSIGSSNHRIDQIKTQLSLDSTIKLVASTQEVSQNLGQGTEIREHKLGQETIKKKSACFCNRMIQRFVKKIQLCSPISRT